MPFVTWHGAVGGEDVVSFDCGPVMFEQAEMAKVASARAMTAMLRRDIEETSRAGVIELTWWAWHFIHLPS